MGIVKIENLHDAENGVHTENTPKALHHLAPGCRNSGYPG